MLKHIYNFGNLKVLRINSQYIDGAQASPD